MCVASRVTVATLREVLCCLRNPRIQPERLPFGQGCLFERIDKVRRRRHFAFLRHTISVNDNKCMFVRDSYRSRRRYAIAFTVFTRSFADV